MPIQPYLMFDGRCDEALAFYRQAVGAEIQMLMRYKESPAPTGMPPDAENKVMHATVKIGDAIINAADGHCGGNPRFEGIVLSFIVATEAEATRYFKGLSDGGQVQAPLTKTFFSPSFGMLTDRFGVAWMIYVAPPESPKP